MKVSMTRKPAVAGQFYPDTHNVLSKELESLIDKSRPKENAIGVVSPHAGYMYSGHVAGAVLGSIKPKPIYLIMGPNHTGLGEQFSICASDTWKTPLGDARVNAKLAAALKKECGLLAEDETAHLYEHSIEVQLPFLQAMQKDFTFVPIVIAQADLKSYKTLGRSISAVVKELKMENDITIIASSDMTHYEPQNSAEEKDKKAISAILELDEDKLVALVGKFNITMCGYAPAAIMLAAAKDLGAKKAELVKYQTSGDTSGDFSSVVGYAGIIIK